MTRWHCCTRPKAEGNSASGHPQHLRPRATVPSGHPQHRGCDSFDCCTERYEIVVLLPNSELTNGNNKRDAEARRVRLQQKTMAGAAL